MPLQIGQEFAGYTILRVLGAGGMGTVYLATHPRLPRQDALKVLPAEFTGDAEYRARFAREADLAAGLSHPHIVGVQDRGEYDGQFWISMDYVAGTDLAQLLTERYQAGVPVDEVVEIVTAVGSALDYAHGRRLLHRDVKPANILLTDPDGQGRRVFLADFGIARRIEESSDLTGTNMAIGTVAYAAPEQLMGLPLDGRADQYALACTAFHLLTGEPPYPHGNPTVVVTQHVSAPTPSIGTRRAEFTGLDPVFARALAKQPSGRFGSCAEFAGQLETALTGSGAEPAYARTAPALPAPISASASAAALMATAPALPSPPTKRSGRRTAILIGAIVSITLLIGAGVFLGFGSTGRRQAAPGSSTPSAGPTPTSTSISSVAPPPPTSETPPTPGPLNGTYRAEFGPSTDLDGHAGGGGSFTASYGLRSMCGGGSGCVATAALLAKSAILANSLVFDEIDGRWVAVAVQNDKCRNVPTESWQVYTLQPGPDGTFTGDMTRTTTQSCRDKRTLTLTRTGDIDLNTLPDPAGLPPRVASPAEALRGRYQIQRTFLVGAPNPPEEAAVSTACLRTGDRCASYFHGSAGDIPLTFANGVWNASSDEDVVCPAGGTTHFSITGHFPLPQPLQNPIQLLSGQGHLERTGNCATNVDFNQTFTRTGD